MQLIPMGLSSGNKTGGGEFSPAIASDGTIYFGSDDNFLYAIGSK